MDEVHLCQGLHCRGRHLPHSMSGLSLGVGHHLYGISKGDELAFFVKNTLLLSCCCCRCCKHVSICQQCQQWRLQIDEMMHGVLHCWEDAACEAL